MNVPPLRLLSVLLIAALAACSKERVAIPQRGPVVIISVDTLRADHLPAYGYRGVRTPNIDGLAKDGLLFEEAYSNVPLTLPSHVSMLTGELPATNGVRNNLGYQLDVAKHPTIASMLKQHGYATAAAVSAYVLRGNTGLAAAFDWYDDTMDESEGATVSELQRAGPRTVAAAESWVDRNIDGPFFLLLHLYEPHAPYTPPDPFRTEYAGHEYDGEIAAADAAVGEFLRFLRQRKLYDQATIIFMSDHGEGLGDHGESQHGIFLYREAIRVPLMVKLPASKRAGTRISTPVELLDIYPTIAEITGARPRSIPAGRSLLAIAGGEKPERGIYSETMYPRIHLGLSDLASLVEGDNHFIDAPRAELYDMKSDPQEKRNLTAVQRRVSASMKRAVGTYDRTLAPPSAITGEEAAKLAALGYLSAPVSGAPTGDPKDHIAELEAAASAGALIEQGRAEEAIGILRGLVARNSRFADAWSELGKAYHDAGRPEESIEAYRKAIAVAPMLATDAAISLAQSYLEIGKPDESIEHAKLALPVHPGAAHSVLTAAYLTKGDVASAEREAEALMSDSARRCEGLVATAQVRIAEKRFDEAWSLAETARAVAAESGRRVPLLAFVRADLLARRGELGAAEQSFLEEIQAFPRDREAYVRLAALQVLQGRAADAEETFDRMVKASPGRASYLVAADALQRLGQPAAATRWKRRAR